MKHTIYLRWLESPTNCGRNQFFSLFLEFVWNILFIIKVGILMPVKCSFRSPQLYHCWTHNGYHFLSMQIQSLLNTRLCSWSHISLKYWYPDEKKKIPDEGCLPHHYSMLLFKDLNECVLYEISHCLLWDPKRILYLFWEQTSKVSVTLPTLFGLNVGKTSTYYC